jgi:N-acetylmuramoyl-L-alanine amidase
MPTPLRHVVPSALRCRLSGFPRAALLALCGLAPLAAWASLAVLAPAEEARRTPRDVVHVLGRTVPGATAQVAGVTVPVQTTGVFVRDGVPLVAGTNAVPVQVTLPDGRVLSETLQIERVAPPPPPPPLPAKPLQIDAASLLPRQPLRLPPGEWIELAMRASPGQLAEARLHDGPWQRLVESPAGSGQYRGRLKLAGPNDRPDAAVTYRLSPPASARASRPASRAAPRRVEAQSPAPVALWHPDTVRRVQVTAEQADLTWGLHEVRLGGPNVAEVPRGTALQAVAQVGDRLRLQLADDLVAYGPVAAFEPLPAGPTPRRPVVTTASVEGSADGDMLVIPWPAPSPYAVRAVMPVEGDPRHGPVALEVELFGTHPAATWITHRSSRQLVREVNVHPSGAGRVVFRAVLGGPPLWGWQVERTPQALRIRLRPPPPSAATEAPLRGLTVAVEAGHGGPENLGAVGATRVPEKDVNRWTADALMAELQAAGARVVDIRVGDEALTLGERAARVTASGADVFISIHANAVDPAGGYLRGAGTGMFVKHSSSQPLAEALQQRMLQATGLPDLGVIGNFNYAPIRRVTAMPSVLVELAYLSNPVEEALLLDPAVRQRMVRALRDGLEDHLRHLPQPARQLPHRRPGP